MKCPHCTIDFHDTWRHLYWNQGLTDPDKVMGTWWTQCSACKRITLRLIRQNESDPLTGVLIWPRRPARAALPTIVDQKFADDYREACVVLADSPKASAALSRRCLQNLLRDKASVKAGNLNDEIDQVLKSGTLGSNLADSIHGVRIIGNFAAHPTKSTNTGEVIDVEPGEAEWLLDTLEKLFDFFFVEPDRIAKRREEINKKLIEAGKQPLK
jgi:hypothetical protein